MSHKSVIIAALLGLYSVACTKNIYNATAAGPQPRENQRLEQFQGAGSSGGGKGVVCRDSSGRINRPVEVLDLWEARALNGQPVAEVSSALDQQVDAALSKLSKAIPNTFLESYVLNGRELTRQQHILEEMRDEAKMWLQNHDNLKKLRGYNLTLTPDSFEVATPSGDCRIEQLVHYTLDWGTPEVYVNADLTDHMSTTQYAALISHEVFYKTLRSLSREDNSVRVRRAVRQVFGGGSYTPYPIPASAAWHCSGGTAGLNNTSELIIIEGTTGPDSKAYSFLPLQISGVIPVGLKDLTFTWGENRKGGIDADFARPEPTDIGVFRPSILSDLDPRFNFHLAIYAGMDGKPKASVRLIETDATSNPGGEVDLGCYKIKR